MPDVKLSATVPASPDRVFAFLADLENWPRWQSDMKETRLVSGVRGQVGARYHYVSKAMGRTLDSHVTVTRVEPGRLVAFEGEWVGMIRPDGAYWVEPAPGGGALVTLNPHPQVRGFGKVMAPLMGSMIKRLQKDHLEKLAAAMRSG